jgi:prevent-host-death family protein
VSEISATEAARNFADLLDAVEHRSEHFTITRRGKVVAQLEPVGAGRGRDVKAVLRRHRIDPHWEDDLAAVRGVVELDER